MGSSSFEAVEWDRDSRTPKPKAVSALRVVFAFVYVWGGGEKRKKAPCVLRGYLCLNWLWFHSCLYSQDTKHLHDILYLLGIHSLEEMPELSETEDCPRLFVCLFVFVLCFPEGRIRAAQSGSNSPCKWNWPWTPNPPASIPKVLGLCTIPSSRLRHQTTCTVSVWSSVGQLTAHTHWAWFPATHSQHTQPPFPGLFSVVSVWMSIFLFLPACFLAPENHTPWLCLSFSLT